MLTITAMSTSANRFIIGRPEDFAAKELKLFALEEIGGRVPFRRERRQFFSKWLILLKSSMWLIVSSKVRPQESMVSTKLFANPSEISSLRNSALARMP